MMSGKSHMYLERECIWIYGAKYFVTNIFFSEKIRNVFLVVYFFQHCVHKRVGVCLTLNLKSPQRSTSDIVVLPQMNMLQLLLILCGGQCFGHFVSH